jgi:hypothetical protein
MPQHPEIRTYERNLREVFWPGDREFAIRAARLCVLYEDLRIEYQGARSDDLKPLDELSAMYRRFYFFRRSLVTLDEFGSALNRLNEIKSWKKYVEQHPDEQLRRRWREAVTFFQTNKKRFGPIRDDIGGHYLESAAKYSVNNLTPGSTGKMVVNLDYEKGIASAELHFSTELVANVVRRTMTNQDPSLDELHVFLSEIFGMVTTGWQRAVDAVNIVIVKYLLLRFEQK